MTSKLSVTVRETASWPRTVFEDAGFASCSSFGLSGWMLSRSTCEGVASNNLYRK